MKIFENRHADYEITFRSEHRAYIVSLWQAQLLVEENVMQRLPTSEIVRKYSVVLLSSNQKKEFRKCIVSEQDSGRVRVEFYNVRIRDDSPYTLLSTKLLEEDHALDKILSFLKYEENT